MADAANGEVSIVLDGTEYTLRSSLSAAKGVSSLGGGYLGVLGRLGVLDHDTYVAVVAFGLNKKPIDVEEKVYRTGLPAITAAVSLYVTFLGNGGKPVEAAKDGDGSGEG